ncbi:Cthe_2314 family HEPN domain-containing protein [Janthinobacterium lividum]|uniref:Cthe_2314 family HEPN domain-containing protein n=1 Tax=Janthinobacterium lividum TaxID=29581 RepID=UPI001B813776|nr:Cthe_2314 family HEPN domain-containing protein [Janthinobacterium lividum]MBR7631815.1 hypothetical protein [Janthinobacterium lividum]
MEKYSHPIQPLMLLDDQSPLMKGGVSRTGEVTISTDLQGYIFSCAKGLGVLTSALDKAALSIEFLAQSVKPLKVSSYTHAEQIQFAIENYFIRSATIYDRALIFASHLLDLGVADESTSHLQMVTNRHVKRYQLADHLKDLGKVCREKNVERNAIIHHRSYSKDEFNQFSMIISANEISKLAGKKAPFPRKAVKDLTDAVLSDHTADFEEHLEKVTRSLNDFLDTAAAVYKIRRESYSNKADGDATT